MSEHNTYNADHYPTILNHVETNTDLIYIFDNTVPVEDLKRIKKYDWFLGDWNNGYNYWPSPSTELPFADLLCKIMVDHLKSIDQNIKVVEHIGSYYVLRHQTKNNLTDNIHRDYYNKKHVWTGVFHLIGESTPTVFYPNFQSVIPIKQVEFKPGRLVIFPSLYAHKAGDLDINETRLIHSIRLLLDWDKNQNYF
jgi:hypothetical protein